MLLTPSYETTIDDLLDEVLPNFDEKTIVAKSDALDAFCAKLPDTTNSSVGSIRRSETASQLCAHFYVATRLYQFLRRLHLSLHQMPSTKQAVAVLKHHRTKSVPAIERAIEGIEKAVVRSSRVLTEQEAVGEKFLSHIKKREMTKTRDHFQRGLERIKEDGLPFDKNKSSEKSLAAMAAFWFSPNRPSISEAERLFDGLLRADQNAVQELQAKHGWGDETGTAANTVAHFLRDKKKRSAREAADLLAAACHGRTVSYMYKLLKEERRSSAASRRNGK